MKIFPMVPSVNENSERESNLMPSALYWYLPRSAFLVSSTDLNNQSFNLKSVFKFLNHGIRI